MADLPAAISPGDVIASGLCIGCGGCASDAPATMGWDEFGQLKPDGPPAWLHQPTARQAAICPFSPTAANEDVIAADRFPAAPVLDPRLGRVEQCHVGHVAEPGFRDNGSSGGMVSWVAAELLRRGLVDGVAHVAPSDRVVEDRLFRYRISRTAEELGQGAKSRYYPVDMAQVLDEIRRVPGRYAVIGIPCFIKAVHLARADDPVLEARVTHMLGLFCGHMKSARLVDSFAQQMGAEPAAVKAVNYRVKNADRPANWYRTQLSLSDGNAVEQDWWHLVEGDWGSGFFQNSACNFCDDVVAETADISFGDAWVEPYSSDGRGTNVVVTRSPQLLAIVNEAIGDGRLALEEVDTNFVADTQAAGFRHRREGLAWRLAHRSRAEGLMPVKRVAPATAGVPRRRRAVYAMRRTISWASHRLFAMSLRNGDRAIYQTPTRWMVALYGALTYGRGRLGRLLDRIDGTSR
ncbi:coenzyme F420 hydrogenase [Croceibacterium mercuriale]|uniref:Coenzyme F420 hydrogenase n=1 Tax=Croceibacterium mercuriale TaxID=1572751 RepID=A0A0B2BX00_9SPHN|nr:Coenzyme F420 hydrogenase/dehydrogenase, beta subunit C-terminal domain [Croceibacterium mercuriale]KHL26138.1 coenzyme F420 hydrogenase [Croceibacterium mercuriale]